MKRVPWLYLAVLAATLWVAFRPTRGEDTIRDSGGTSALTGITVEGLTMDAGDGFPPLTAARATASGGTGLIDLGGHLDHLALEDIRVDLGTGLRLAAPRGARASGRLTLSDVRILEGDRLLLRAAEAELRPATDRSPVALSFPGIAVLWPGADDEQTLIDLACDLGELRARLRVR